MVVNLIKAKGKATVIEFKKKDVTSLEALQHIASGMANLYSYEAASLWSDHFNNFMANLKYRVTYVIVVGRDVNDKCCTVYGKKCDLIKR